MRERERKRDRERERGDILHSTLVLDWLGFSDCLLVLSDVRVTGVHAHTDTHTYTQT